MVNKTNVFSLLCYDLGICNNVTNICGPNPALHRCNEGDFGDGPSNKFACSCRSSPTDPATTNPGRPCVPSASTVTSPGGSTATLPGGSTITTAPSNKCQNGGVDIGGNCVCPSGFAASALCNNIICTGSYCNIILGSGYESVCQCVLGRWGDNCEWIGEENDVLITARSKDHDYKRNQQAHRDFLGLKT
ncbi:unnamed protein product [Didymodactylos carnosus]|uniref:EGF-like domain-containing protein n=1 Tax=Didymodactylos carnosus TaxID=1234261 RepID=A0A815YQC0_9BILA|nr:unnamed protein product [Didymodactylos carnosus]CAF4436317.1 unnamed protein product [Didymodactylos carnosus]